MAPVLLCFGLNEQQMALLAFLCGGPGIRLKQIPCTQYGQTIAALSDQSGMGPALAPDAPFRDAMIVMCGFSQKQFNLLLDAMKNAGTFRNVLKAVATPDNLRWTAMRLHQELSLERAALQSGERAHRL